MPRLGDALGTSVGVGSLAAAVGIAAADDDATAGAVDAGVVTEGAALHATTAMPSEAAPTMHRWIRLTGCPVPQNLGADAPTG